MSLVRSQRKLHSLVIGQIRTDEINEITAIPELLNMLDIKGKIITTIDAMGCQKDDIAEDTKTEVIIYSR